MQFAYAKNDRASLQPRELRALKKLARDFARMTLPQVRAAFIELEHRHVH